MNDEDENNFLSRVRLLPQRNVLHNQIDILIQSKKKYKKNITTQRSIKSLWIGSIRLAITYSIINILSSPLNNNKLIQRLRLFLIFSLNCNPFLGKC